MAILSENVEKECVKETYPTRERKFDLCGTCAAILAIDELLFWQTKLRTDVFASKRALLFELYAIGEAHNKYRILLIQLKLNQNKTIKQHA